MKGSTVFCEAEAILNDRPITKASDDPDDLEALTPNHILTLKGKPHCKKDNNNLFTRLCILNSLNMEI